MAKKKKLNEILENKRNSENILRNFLHKVNDFRSVRFNSFKSTTIRLKSLFYRRGKLPDFLVIGVMKGGTSSLNRNLKKHPSIEMAPNFSELRFFKSGRINKKEIRFFTQKSHWQKGVQWYKHFFNKNRKLQGEATPGYIFQLHAHERMKNVVPKAKLILALRDPVTRAYSHFNHLRQLLPHTKNWCLLPYGTFEQNIEAELKVRLKGGFLSRGLYMHQIEHLLKYFPRKQLLILISERMKNDMPGTYERIFKFLGAKNVAIDFIQGVHSREYEQPLKKETARQLQEIYNTHNEQLFKFLGYQIPEWKH